MRSLTRPLCKNGISGMLTSIISIRRWGRKKTQEELDAESASRVQQLMDLRSSGQPLAELSDFAKEYGDEAFCRRLLRKYDGNVSKASDKFKQALIWREANRELLSTRQHVLGG